MTHGYSTYIRRKCLVSQDARLSVELSRKPSRLDRSLHGEEVRDAIVRHAGLPEQTRVVVCKALCEQDPRDVTSHRPCAHANESLAGAPEELPMVLPLKRIDV